MVLGIRRRNREMSMRTWKIALATILLVAPTAYGASALMVTAENWDATAKTFDLVISVDPAGQQYIGMSIFAKPNTPVADNAFKIVSRQFAPDGPGLISSEPGWSGSIANKYLTASTTGKDLGGSIDTSDVDHFPDGYATAGGLVQTLHMVLTNTADPTPTSPVKLSFWGAFTDPDYAAKGFGNARNSSNPLVVELTPEPASMLLLAAGAAFFARRRKA